MSPVAERSRPLHVDVVRRVESGHVLVLESHDLEELVGQIADDRALGWEFVGPLTTETRETRVEWFDGECHHSDLLPRTVYLATLVRGVPGSPLGMDMKSSEDDR